MKLDRLEIPKHFEESIKKIDITQKFYAYLERNLYNDEERKESIDKLNK